MLLVAVLGLLTQQQQKVWADTITLWKYAAAGEPDSKVVRWHLLNARGRVFADSGEFDKAIEQFEAVLKIDPQNVEALNNLGLSLALAGRAGEAIEPLPVLLRLKPNDADVHCNLGSALLAQGRNLEDAIAHLRRATELKPAMVQAYVAWARTETARGYPKRAVPQWKKVVQLMPWSAPERLQLARALHKAGHREEAAAQLRKALVIKPDLAAARSELEQILKEQGRPK